MTIIEKTKNEFIKVINDFGKDPYQLLSHVPEVEKWAIYLLKKYPQADMEVVLLSVWLHDIGHYPVPADIDHAVRSEQRAREFLEKENYSNNKIDKVLHCVRAHRCNDIIPETLEAKIIACVDSASHMTSSLYFDIAKNDKENNREFKVYSKIERDYRDLAAFPEIQNKLKEIYETWIKLIKTYEKIDLN